MGRLELQDRPVDWVSVTKEYLHELYDEIARLKREKAVLQAEAAAMEQQLRATALGRAA